MWISAEMTTRKVTTIINSTFIIVTMNNAVVKIYICRYDWDKGAVIRICVQRSIINCVFCCQFMALSLFNALQLLFCEEKPGEEEEEEYPLSIISLPLLPFDNNLVRSHHHYICTYSKADQQNPHMLPKRMRRSCQLSKMYMKLEEEAKATQKMRETQKQSTTAETVREGQNVRSTPEMSGAQERTIGERLKRRRS